MTRLTPWTPLILTAACILTALGAEAADAPVAPAAGSATRVGGQAEAELERLVAPRSGDVVWRAGRCSIETPLPEGYAPPTPPGALEIKSYPTVRRALVSGEARADAGSGAFWPLFRHIQRRDIAMTSPVEMDYHGARPGVDAAPTGWSMAFLYRRVEQGPTGRDGVVEVQDSPPTTVLAAGVRGPYEGPHVTAAVGRLADWLAAHPEWETAGDLRALHYNSPFVRGANKWGEVQVPIRRSTR